MTQLMPVQKVSMWIPVTNEALEDAPWMRLRLEYAMTGAEAPLTAPERLTGWRSFTSSDGLTGEFRVGWRLVMWNALRVVRCAATDHKLGEWMHDDDAWFSRECECRTRRESKQVEP